MKKKEKKDEKWVEITQPGMKWFPKYQRGKVSGNIFPTERS